jgi:hypothetical protein
MKVEELLENANQLSDREKLQVAHCLLMSVENTQEIDVDDSWVRLAQQRFTELKSKQVEGTTWEQIKANIRG